MLDKIPGKHWLDYILLSFKNSNKNITEEMVIDMIHRTNNHPDYLQQLCHNVWNGTDSETTNLNIDEAMNLVVDSNRLHYQDICDALSN